MARRLQQPALLLPLLLLSPTLRQLLGLQLRCLLLPPLLPRCLCPLLPGLQRGLHLLFSIAIHPAKRIVLLLA